MGRHDITQRLSSTLFGYSRTGRTSSNARATQVTNSLKQWRLDPAGNTGGGLHSLVPRSVGNSDITPNLVERLRQSRCHLHGSYRWWPSSSGRQASIVLVESSTGEATLPIQVPSSGPSRAIALPRRTSLPLVQHLPTRRTDLPGAGLVQSRSSLTRTTGSANLEC